MSRKTLILDSSQIDSYLTCPTLWHLNYVEDLTLSNEIREDMAAGTYGHKLLEIYYTALALGRSVQDAVAEAQHFHVNDNFPLTKETRDKVASRFNDYWMIHCAHDIIPALGAPTYRIEITCICTHHSHKHIGDDGKCTLCSCANYNEIIQDVYDPKPLVEQGFSYELLNNEDFLFVLEGRIDLIGSLSGQMCWMDHKFQGRKRGLYKKSIQFRNYALVTNLSIGVINYIRMAKIIESDTLQRVIVSFPPWDRAAWKAELIEIYKSIALSMETGTPKNRSSCAGKYGYECQYTKICEESNLITIQAIKETNYKKREKWSPW